MKILLATDGKTLKSTIAKRFGHANYYVIFDSESKGIDVRENSGHDDNHSSLLDLTNEGVSKFIVGNIGPNAFSVLNKANCEVYLARKQKAEEALEKLSNNELEKLSNPTLKRSFEDH